MAKRDQPVINLKRTAAQNILEVVCAVIFVFGVVYSFVFLKNSPAMIPTHFAMSGAPDGMGNKFGILMYPLLSAVLFALLWILEFNLHILRYPCKVTKENAGKLYNAALLMLIALKLESALVFLYFIIGTELIVLNKTSGLFPYYKLVIIILPVLTVVDFVLYCGKVSPPEKI